MKHQITTELDRVRLDDERLTPDQAEQLALRLLRSAGTARAASAIVRVIDRRQKDRSR